MGPHFIVFSWFELERFMECFSMKKKMSAFGLEIPAITEENIFLLQFISVLIRNYKVYEISFFKSREFCMNGIVQAPQVYLFLRILKFIYKFSSRILTSI